MAKHIILCIVTGGEAVITMVIIFVKYLILEQEQNSLIVDVMKHRIITTSIIWNILLYHDEKYVSLFDFVSLLGLHLLFFC